ncbi:hypothetical protein QN239_26830 [Mycolicibacterium sp. Y3]
MDALNDKGLYSVHCFAGSDAAAQAGAMRAYERIVALAPPFGMGQPVTIGDRTIYADDVIVREGPRDVTYTEDRSVVDWCATYELRLRRGSANNP